MKKKSGSMANPEEEESLTRNPSVLLPSPHHILHQQQPFKRLKPSSSPPLPPLSNNPSIHPSPSPSPSSSPPSSSSSQYHPFPPNHCYNDKPSPLINPNLINNNNNNNNNNNCNNGSMPFLAPNLTPPALTPKLSSLSPPNSQTPLNMPNIPITHFAESPLLPFFCQTITATSSSSSNPIEPLCRPSATAMAAVNNNNILNSVDKNYPHSYTLTMPSITPSAELLSKPLSHYQAFNLAPSSLSNLISSSATTNYSFQIGSSNLPQSINPDSSFADHLANYPTWLTSSLKSNWSSSPPPLPPLPLSLLSHPLPATTSSSSSAINASETQYSPPGVSHGNIQHQTVKESCRKKGSLEFNISMESNIQSSPPWVTVGIEGRSIGGRICLQHYNGYPSFARAIRQMFAGTSSCINIPNAVPEQDYTLESAVPSHIIAYEDIEGDLLLAGDLSWRDFVRVAKRIRILPSQRPRK